MGNTEVLKNRTFKVGVMAMFHKLKAIYILPNFILRAHFVEGVYKLYDLKPLFTQIEAFQQLLQDEKLYCKVKVDVGGYGIVWNDELDLSCDEIWEHGTTITSPFDGLLSFSDATKLWGLNESTLRKAISYGKLLSGIDACKFGNQWIVTKEAMLREYGQPAADVKNTTVTENVKTSNTYALPTEELVFKVAENIEDYGSKKV